MKFEREVFFKEYRTQFGKLSQQQVDGLEFLLAGFECDPAWDNVKHIAYALATIKHETADTYLPIYEYGPKSYFNKYDGRKDLGNNQPGDGYRYRGAGFVMITGRTNFRRFGIEDNPEQAIDPQTSFDILTVGMHQGSFTGKKLSDYFNKSVDDPKNARRIINGLDKSKLIAQYYEHFLSTLKSE